MINLGQGHLLTLASLSSIHTFSETAWPISEILCGASMGRGNESLIAKFGSHDQDGRHAQLW